MKPIVFVTCEHCSKSFKKQMFQSNRFCSKLCYNTFRADYKKKKYAEYKAQDIIHGRTIKEHKYHIYKSRAYTKEIPFEITIDQFLELWQKPCTYCCSPIPTIGVDRVDNKLGYILTNIAPCCTTCNLMKRGMNSQDFIAHCKKIR